MMKFKTKEELQKAFNFKLTYDVPFTDKADFYIYEESTADGYSIFVAAQNPDNITIEENVYYYDSDLGDALLDALRHYDCKNIYIDDPSAYWVEEIMAELLVWITVKKLHRR